MSWFQDALDFDSKLVEKTGQKRPESLNVAFIHQMVQDELKELVDARDTAEKVDALLDIVYYCLHTLAKTGLDMDPIWTLIHRANMSKFDSGYLNSAGKWCKGPDFVAPDDAIREEIAWQETLRPRSKKR